MSKFTTEQFFAKVNPNGPTPAHRPDLGPCHVWLGYRMPEPWSYGRLGFQGRYVLAHRLAFYLAHGRWPEPNACHHCDNPSCVNPAHLFEGSHQDNVDDRETKGRNKPPPRGEKHHSARLTENDVRAIRAVDAADTSGRLYGRRAKLARRYGVAPETIASIVLRRIWKDVT